MRHRAFTAVVLLSTVAFVAVGACVVRQRWFDTDQVEWLWWRPSTGRYAQVEVWSGGGFAAHAEFGRAASPADASILRLRAGWKHMADPVRLPADRPLLWVEHYRSSPYVGIDQHGIADSWAAELSNSIPLVTFGVLPGIGAAAFVRRWYQFRRRPARGFAILP